MLIPLDVVTRKKLMLVKQMYLRALVQSQTAHSFVDRILAVIGFDLANETILKVIVSTLNPKKNITDNFQGVLAQAEEELKSQSVITVHKVKIQHVHNLRNDAQHKAKYPNENDPSDCRTYTRDFLTEVIFDVWGESFESISLVDVVQNNVVKNLLLEAEQEFAKGEFSESVIKSIGAFQIIIAGLANTITGEIDYQISGFVVKKRFKNPESNSDVLSVFNNTRELVAFQTIGINSQEYLRYKKFTRFVIVDADKTGSLMTRVKSQKKPTKEEAEFVFNFATNTIVLIETLD